MTSADEARAIADAALRTPGGPEVTLGPHTGDVPDWWVFSFNMPEYWATGDVMTAVIGAGPIAVSKVDGHVEWLKNMTDPVADLAARPVRKDPGA